MTEECARRTSGWIREVLPGGTDRWAGRFEVWSSPDPGEDHDLSTERPEQLALLRGELEAVRTRLDLPALDADLAAGASTGELDEATQERLRQLGYIE